MEPVTVALGYLEETQTWKLGSRFFPSKVGGKPAWLDLLHLPTNEDLKCPKCQHPCMFLCQIYAPWMELDYCFHRTIFVFLCVDADCWEANESRTFKVFRCQFGRRNDFYPYDPPIDDENWRPDLTAETYNKLCIVCGAKGTSHCGRCKNVNYCSRQHQIIDWKTGHREICLSGSGKAETKSMRTLWLLPEFEIMTGREDEDSEDSSCSNSSDEEGDEETEKRELDKFRELLKQGNAGTFQGNSMVDNDLLRMATSNEDKDFLRFRSKIAKFPQQVLRYERSGSPLWMTSDNIPEANDIPPCPYCNAPRDFELQVMPQMLNYLALDSVRKSVDWGVLAIYTCRNSCDTGAAYKQEFLWKQDIRTTNDANSNSTSSAVPGSNLQNCN